MITAPRVRTASHLVTQFSQLMRSETPPTPQQWKHMLSLYGADEAFEVSNELLDLAKAIEKKAAAQ